MASQRGAAAKIDSVNWSSAKFIGRQREFSCIWEHYEASRKTRSGVTLLLGEPGIGKTRLLNEFAQRAILDGAIVLRGTAFEADGMPPYLPFLEAIGRYIRVTPWEQLQKQIAHAPHVLLSIFPELAERLDDQLFSHPQPPEQARLRLYEAIGLFLENISASSPLVLILDDLHWVDTASLDLLSYITRHHTGNNMLVLGAYRESEVGRNPALGRTLTELVRLRMLTTLVVEPLARQETEELATSLLDGPISGDVSQLLYMQSEGNPFFTEELIRSWVEGRVLLRDERWWYAPVLLELTLPSSIMDALRQRFALLTPETLGHLRVASIIGRTFDMALLAAVESEELEHIEEQLVEAERARLIRLEQTGRHTFYYDNIRACLYAEVNNARRRRLHEAIGHVLEERYMKERTKSLYELVAIAFHFTHGGDSVRGIAYNQQAIEQGLQSLANEETHQRRIDFIERSQQQNAYPWLALLLSFQGFWHDAEQAVTRAHPLSSPESLSFLWRIRGFLAFQQNDYATAERHFRAARVSGQHDSADLLISTSMLSVALATGGRLAEAEEALNELELLLSEAPNNALPLAHIMTCMTLTAIALGDTQRMKRFYTQLLPWRGQYYLFLVDRVLGELCAARGDWAQALMYLDDAESAARRKGLRPELARILLTKASYEMTRDDADSRTRAVSILLSTLNIFEELHLAEAASHVLAQLDTLAPRVRDGLYDQPINIPYSQRTKTAGSATRVLPASLTRSEAKVVQLVAHGKSNRQIAQELGISEKTVANHLSHIFSKTTSENRAAAAAFAIRNGIA